MKNRERLIRRLRKALSRKSFQNRFNSSMDQQWQTMEQLEERMLLSVTAFDDVYNITEDEVFRTGDVTQVISANDAWDYNDEIAIGSAYPTDGLGSPWNSPIFDVGTSNVGTWTNAAGPFEDGTIDYFVDNNITATVIDAPSDAETTVLFRSDSFDVANSSAINQLQFNYLFDDGAVIYLNGQEVFRANMPVGAVTPDTLTGNAGDEGALTSQTVALPNGLLLDNDNVIAIELHNTSLTSSDSGFYFEASVIESAGMGVLENDDLTGQVGALTVDDGVAPPNNSNVLVVQDDLTLQQVGTATILPNGDFTYTPTLPDFNGTASFEYVITDNDGSSSAFVTLNIAPANDAPTGNPDAYTAGEGEAISATGASAPVLVNFGSTWEYNDNITNGGDGNPAQGYPEDVLNGLQFAELGYDIAQSDPSVGAWEVAAGPFEAGTVNAFEPGSGNQLAGVATTALDGIDAATNGENLVTTYLFRQEFTGSAATTTLFLEYVVDDGAVFYLNGQEIFRTTSMDGVPFGTNEFSTGTENEDDIRTALIDVTGIMASGDNVIAVEVHQTNATSSDAGFALQMTDVTETPGVLVNDPPDPDGDPIEAQLVDDLDLQNLENFGTLVFNTDGTFTFTPSGTVAIPLTFNYVVSDGSATSDPIPVTLNFTPVDAGPVVANDDNFTTPEDTPLVIDDQSTEGTLGYGPLVNDVPPAGDETDPIQIVVTDTSNLNGTLAINDDGTFTYTPNADFAGQATFSYQIQDVGFPLSLSNEATVTIDVTPVADPPVGAADNYTMDEDTTLVVDDPGFGAITPVINFGADWFYLDDGSDQGTAWSAAGFDADAAGWESGPGQLGYGDGDETTVVDFGGDDANKHVTTYFQSTFDLDDPASVAGLNLTTLFDDGVAVYINGVEVFRADLDAGAAFDTLATGGADNQTVAVNLDVDALGLNLQATGNTIAAEVHQNALGSSDLSFDLELEALEEGVFGLLANDSDPDAGDTLGNATVVPGLGAFNGTLNLNSDGTFDYTPDADFFGTEIFFYTVEDSQGNVSDPIRVDIVVNNTDDPVTGVNDEYMVVTGETLNVTAPDLDATFNTTGDEIISAGSDWFYLDDGSDQGTAWSAAGFNAQAAGWASGPAQLGYGDGDEATVIGFGPDPDTKFTTTYFQRTFDVDDPSSIENLNLTTLWDDGVAVYINGVEVFRQDLPDGAAFDTFANGGTGDNKVASVNLDLLALGITLQETGNTIAAEVHQDNLTSSDLSFDLSLQEADFIIPEGSVWKYLDDGSDQGTAWTDPFFNDSEQAGWSEGNAQLGYGEGDEVTTVGFGPDADNKFPTTYFRHSFNLDNPDSIENLVIYLLRDDGAAVYINGVEVVRDNLIPLASSSDYASVDGSEGTFMAYGVDLDAAGITLQETANVVAVEVHQFLPTSSDISFDLRLRAVDSLPAVGVLANDINPDEDVIEAILVDAPAQHDGTFTLNVDGTFSYTPVDGFTGTDSFTYEIQDGAGGVLSGPITVEIEVKDEDTGASNPGDFNNDLMADATDIDLLAEAIRNGSVDPLFDTDEDGDVDTDDYDFMISDILGTLPGDATLDGIVNLEDLAKLATFFGQSAQGWEQGDFTGDTIVNLEDLAKLATFFGQSTEGGKIDYSGGAAASGEALLGAADGEDDDDDSSWDHIASVLD